MEMLKKKRCDIRKIQREVNKTIAIRTIVRPRDGGEERGKNALAFARGLLWGGTRRGLKYKKKQKRGRLSSTSSLDRTTPQKNLGAGGEGEGCQGRLLPQPIRK